MSTRRSFLEALAVLPVLGKLVKPEQETLPPPLPPGLRWLDEDRTALLDDHALHRDAHTDLGDLLLKKYEER
jgi:hypothetical protein